VNGELAQLVCLATYGTVWLAQGETHEPPALEQGNSTFQYVGKVSYLLRDPATAVLASTATEWLRQLRDRGTTRLWLEIPGTVPVAGGDQPGEFQLAAFANAGRWLLKATGGPEAEFWSATWTVHDRDAPQGRIWSVSYEGIRTAGAEPQRPTVSAAQGELTAALTSARDFAIQQDLQPWPDWFERALNSDNAIPFHPDMAPAAYPVAARRLLAMASGAWVFGGMGSWNDLYLEDSVARAAYEVLSRRLYSAVLKAVVACVNAPQPD
jgi:hypothetical protein